MAVIESIEPSYSNSQLRFLNTWNRDYPELVEQLTHFPLAAHDDGPDALAGAISLLLAKEKVERRARIPRLDNMSRFYVTLSALYRRC